MSFVERANDVRHRIPFAYWIAYDVVVAPLMIWGIISLFAIGLVMLAVATFFDLNEAAVKWSRRR
jgi:hypothetical protein